MGPAQTPRRFSLGQTQRPAGLASFVLSRDPAVPTPVEWLGVRDPPVSLLSGSHGDRRFPLWLYGSASGTSRARLAHALIRTGYPPPVLLNPRAMLRKPDDGLRRKRALIRTGGFLILSQSWRAAVTIPCLEPIFFDFLRTVLLDPKNRTNDSGGLWSVPVSDNRPLLNQTSLKSTKTLKPPKKKKNP
jgi:hypothetical protein